MSCLQVLYDYLWKDCSLEERMVPTGTLGVELVGCTGKEEIQKQENAGDSQVQYAPLDLTDKHPLHAHVYYTIYLSATKTFYMSCFMYSQIAFSFVNKKINKSILTFALFSVFLHLNPFLPSFLIPSLLLPQVFPFLQVICQ